MRTLEYTIIATGPFLGTILITFIISCVLKSKKPHFIEKLVLLAFSGILKLEKKTRGHVLIFDDIELTEENIRRANIECTLETLIWKKIINPMFMILFFIWITANTIFWQTLFIDFSYACSDDPNKDCFVFKNIKEGFKEYFDQYTAPAIDCSTIGSNFTDPIICYRFGFNVGIATGVSYGAFKVMAMVVNLVTLGMLLAKSHAQIYKVQIFVFLGFLMILSVALGVLYGVNIPQIKLQSQQLAQVMQIIFSILIGMNVVYHLPWKELVSIKQLAARAELEDAVIIIDANENRPLFSRRIRL